jgi:hypothetical protein
MPTQGRPGGPYTYEKNGYIYTFNRRTGKWDDLDTRAILEIPEGEGEAKSRPK